MNGEKGTFSSIERYFAYDKYLSEQRSEAKLIIATEGGIEVLRKITYRQSLRGIL
jgi:hypothetical protein